MPRANHTLGTLSLFLSLIALAPVTGCVSDRQVIANAAQMHNALSPAVMEDPQLASYLQQIGDRIIDAAKEADREHYGPKTHFDTKEGNTWMFSNRMKFHFVNSKTLNAFTTGGEHMYIYTQLFLECQSEDELAAVMAHEYGHVYARHVAKGQNRQLGLLIGGAVAGGAAGYALGGKDNGASYAAAGAGAGAAGGQFLNMGFTRGDEEQADQLGFHFFWLAGWDVRHFGDFFQHMIDKGLDTTPEFLSDHPSLKNRVATVKKWVADLQKKGTVDKFRRPPIAPPEQFSQLKARAQQLGKTLPDDKSLQSSQKLLQALPRSCVMPIDPPDAQQARHDLAAHANASQKRQ